MDALTLNWAGGEHGFALPLGRLRALQDSCNAGPEEVFNRLRLGNWRVDDVIEPVRLGLIGGGLDEEMAGPLVRRMADQGALSEMKLTAIAVLSHALYGPADDPPGKTGGADPEAPAPESGSSPTSTETAL